MRIEKFNEYSINESISSFFKKLKEFSDYLKGKSYLNTKEYLVMRRVIDFVIEYDKTKFLEIKKEMNNLNEILKKIKEEEQKEYSELKYKLLDELTIRYNKNKKLHNSEIEKYIMKYYNLYGSDFIFDLESTIHWIVGKPHLVGYLDSLNNVRNAFKGTDIDNEFGSSLNIFNESKSDKPNMKKHDIDGFVVYHGKDAKSNDYLTFEMSDDDDIWMHAKGVPGSHVLIKVKNNIPTEGVIKKAAEIAAKNSKGTGKVTVVYCKKKFVTKESGMNVGQVKVDYNNSHYITIDK